MLIVSLLCGMSAGGCVMGQPAEPLFATVGSSYFCGRVQFTITGPTTVTPDWPDRPCNGNPPLAILDAGPMGWDEANGRTLTMPLRIVNRGIEPVQLPVRLILPVNGKTVLNPFETPNSTMIPLNADSTRADGTKVWLVGISGTMGPGDSTAISTVLFQINSPVTEGRFAFTISGETAEAFPAVAPDSTPEWFAHDTSLAAEGYVKRVVAVLFKASSTPSQRMAVVQGIGGTVIGGSVVSGQEGWYLLLVPTASNWESLRNVVELLRANTAVQEAVRVSRLSRLWRLPKDGDRWRDTSWRKGPNLAGASRPTWALEQINAPLAWGCTVGSDSTVIGVLDHGFDTLDLRLAAASSILPSSTRHGFLVSSLIAAKGDNQIGMTGVMWRGTIVAKDLDNPSAFPNDVAYTHNLASRLQAAVGAGAVIVNISVGLQFTPFVFPDSVLEELSKDAFRAVLPTTTRLASVDSLPLLVIAAGNEPMDAKFTGYPRLAENHPQHVIVVGYAAHPVDLGGGAMLYGKAFGSPFGPLVSIYAPGQDIWAVTSTGQDTSVSGSSFAAPLVSGIAGLLKSFKPSLTPQELRQHILDGAADRGASVLHVSTPPKTLYLADAFAALTRVARSQQAPLCGNRIFVDAQNRVQVQRSSPTNLQQIWQGTAGADSIRAVYSYHGGRRVGFFSDALGDRILTFNNGSWSPVPWTPSPPGDLSGSWYSMRRRVHDGDSDVVVLKTPVPGGTNLDVILRGASLPGRPLVSIPIAHLVPSGDSEPSTRSAHYDTTGHFTGWSYGTPRNVSSYETISPGGGRAEPRAVPSPMGDRFLVLVNRFTVSFQGWSIWFPSPASTVKDGQNTFEFRTPSFAVASQRAEIYSVPWAGGTPQPPVRTAQDSTIERMGLSEDGAELVVAIGRYSSGSGSSDPYAGCAIQYWSAAAPFGLRNSFPTVLHVCNSFAEDAGGFAAVIAGGSLSDPIRPSNGFRPRPAVEPETFVRNKR
jgi:subtilisin family serine protease